MDVRAIISGTLAGLAMICGTILAAMDMQQGGVVCFGLASTFGGYVVGLYSEPQQNDDSGTATSDGGNADG